MTSGNLSGGEPFLGEIRMFAGNSEPAGWAFCDGRLLSILDFLALYGVIGTTFGGDGVNNFALPDLCGRVPMGQGAGPGLSRRTLGHHPGSETVNLATAQLSPHTHTVQGTNSIGDQASPGGNALAASPSNQSIYHSTPGTLVNMGPSTGSTGSGAPLPTLQPSLVVNFIISLEGQDPRSGAVSLSSKLYPPSG